MVAKIQASLRSFEARLRVFQARAQAASQVLRIQVYWRFTRWRRARLETRQKLNHQLKVAVRYGRDRLVPLLLDRGASANFVFDVDKEKTQKKSHKD